MRDEFFGVRSFRKSGVSAIHRERERGGSTTRRDQIVALPVMSSRRAIPREIMQKLHRKMPLKHANYECQRDQRVKPDVRYRDGDPYVPADGGDETACARGAIEAP